MAKTPKIIRQIYNLPIAVAIGGVVYDIYYGDEKKYPQLKNAFGACNARQKKIWIDDTLASTFEPNRFSWEATPGITCKQVTGKAELIIPDEWPEFPKEPGDYHIGITSRDDVGNQSDPFLSSGQFRFQPPPPPAKGGVESI